MIASARTTRSRHPPSTPYVPYASDVPPTPYAPPPRPRTHDRAGPDLEGRTPPGVPLPFGRPATAAGRDQPPAAAAAMAIRVRFTV